MNDSERNLQHAMMSFALWGGLLVEPRRTSGGGERMASHPSTFVPIKIGKTRR